MSNLTTFLFIALAVVCCSGYLVKDARDLMKRRQCTWLGCQTSLPNYKRLARSIPDEKLDTTVLYSDLPTDRLLQEVSSQYVSKDEQAEIIQDDNQEMGGIRHKRGVRITVIKICNRRNGICRIIVVQRRY